MSEINKTNLSQQAKFRLSEIIEIEDYFHQEINQRKLCSKRLRKYVTAFDYIDKILIVLSATSSGVCIISSASVVGAPVGIASASFTLTFSLTAKIIKKLLTISRNKKKKHDKILMLAKSKLEIKVTWNFSISSIDWHGNVLKNLMQLLGRNKSMRGWKKMWEMSVKNKKMRDWIMLI